MTDKRRQLLLRVAFLAVLLGGLLLWSRSRTPKELQLTIDLTESLPGNITELDVVISRDGRALFRSDRHYGKEGAPQREQYLIRASPGAVEVEATAISAGRPARRKVVSVELAEGTHALLQFR